MKCEEVTLEMVKLYEAIWRTNEILTSWGHSNFDGKVSPKINKTTQILPRFKNWSKILFILTINRLKHLYEKQLIEQQQGFRAGKSTTGGFYIVKYIHQITDKSLPILRLLTSKHHSVIRTEIWCLKQSSKDSPSMKYKTYPTDGITIIIYNNRTSSNSG